jgi:hypothetical protein
MEDIVDQSEGIGKGSNSGGASALSGMWRPPRLVCMAVTSGLSMMFASIRAGCGS